MVGAVIAAILVFILFFGGLAWLAAPRRRLRPLPARLPARAAAMAAPPDGRQPSGAGGRHRRRHRHFQPPVPGHRPSGGGR
ncbi:hypothetical protein G6F46_014851 [Rhizopus delemar]|nr:hypothetical protein G6F46_014851 [Rhizopus delemar]